MRKTYINVLLLGLYFLCPCSHTQSRLFAQEICTEKQLVEDGADNFSMSESLFQINKAVESVDWLENDFWQVLRQYETIDDLFRATERFGIPYPNSVRIVKGTLLRQEAILAQERLNLVQLKHELGRASEVDIDSAKKRFQTASKAFCDFLNGVTYVD